MSEIEELKQIVSQHAQIIRGLQSAVLAANGLVAELAQQAKISYADAAEQMESAMLFSAIEEQTKDQALQQLRALLGIRP
jgi:hypothetical protein